MKTALSWVTHFLEGNESWFHIIELFTRALKLTQVQGIVAPLRCCDKKNWKSMTMWFCPINKSHVNTVAKIKLLWRSGMVNLNVINCLDCSVCDAIIIFWLWWCLMSANKFKISWQGCSSVCNQKEMFELRWALLIRQVKMNFGLHKKPRWRKNYSGNCCWLSN